MPIFIIIPNQLIYNTIYEERFMGVLPENRDAYLKCNPLTYAKNLQGHLLIMHGAGDHNVNYQGEEMLLNELIKYNRQFQFMPFPNFLRQYCPPGPRPWPTRRAAPVRSGARCPIHPRHRRRRHCRLPH